MDTWWLYVSVLCLIWQRGACQVTPTPIRPACSVLGYNVSALSSAPYWSFNLTQFPTWQVPVDVEVNDIESVTVFMSICMPLPEGRCGENSQSSTCQEVKLKNTSSVYLDMGSYNVSNAFQPLDAGRDGFSIVKHGENPVVTRFCNATLTTFIIFECDPNAKWNSKNPDVSSHAYTSVLSPCIYLVTLSYDGACYIPPTISPGDCQLSSYDTKTLSDMPFWYASVPRTACYNASQDIECSFVFSFCHALPKDERHDFNLDSCYKQQASVCQIGETAEVKQSEYSMGTFQDFTRFEENDDTVGEGFHLDVNNGTKPKNGQLCPNGFSSQITLVCDPAAEWPSNGNLINFIKVPNRTESVDPCQFYLELKYKGACIGQFPIAEPASPVGWILMALFFAAVILYLVIGSSIQYFVKGARGLDVIPNYTLWVYFFGLILEGCRFAMNVITCYQFQNKFRRTEGAEYDKI